MTKKLSVATTNPHDTEVLPAEGTMQLAVYDGPSMGIQSVEDVQMIADSLSADTNEWKLPRAKLPSGDQDAYAVTVLGNVMSAESLTGVIVGTKMSTKAWWKTIGTSAGSFPSCRSENGLRGYGVNELGKPEAENEWHNCGSCQWNNPGTKRMPGGGKGNGKDCKDAAVLLISLPGDLLPTTLVVPPGSLSNWEAFKIEMLTKRVRPSDVVTRFGLEGGQAVGADGSSIAYKKITFKAIGMATKDATHAAAVEYFGEFLKRGSVIEALGNAAIEDGMVEK